MSIELREPGQITRRRFFDLAAKAVAALAVAASIGEILVEEAVMTVFNRHTHGGGLLHNVAAYFDSEQGWTIGTSAVHPETGETIFVALGEQR
jgi:hypothetical protein